MSASSKNPANAEKLCVTRHMCVQEIIALSPQAADIMVEYGLHCTSCHLGGIETIEEGCQIHDMNDEMIDELLDDINTAIAAEPEREWSLTVTPAAAEGIAAIAKAEEREGQMLRIAVDAHGGFCLEFCTEQEEFDQTFFCEQYPDICVYASPLALQRIGGGVIDMRDDRFKLDLPEDQEHRCGCQEETCDCKK